MLVLRLSNEDIEYISALLDREDSKISLLKKQRIISSDTGDRLMKRNSNINSILKARMVPYICVLKELTTEDVYHLSFQEFENYFGKFPPELDEAQIMNHIFNWCASHGYSVEFKRENK